MHQVKKHPEGLLVFFAERTGPLDLLTGSNIGSTERCLHRLYDGDAERWHSRRFNSL